MGLNTIGGKLERRVARAAAEFTRDVMLPGIWDPVAVTLLALPGFVVFLLLALIFYLIGRRPVRRLNRFAVN
jgi:UPF0716 family protein affecting phage T7 exclusion